MLDCTGRWECGCWRGCSIVEALGGVILRGSLFGDEGVRPLGLEERDARLAVTENMRWLGVGG